MHPTDNLIQLQALASLTHLTLEFTSPPDSRNSCGFRPLASSITAVAVAVPKLQELVIKGDMFSSRQLDVLSSLKHLTSLAFHSPKRNEIGSGSACSYIAAMKGLKQLHLPLPSASDTGDNDPHIQLSALTSLTRLTLTGAPVSAACFNELGRMTQLVAVSLPLGPSSGDLEGTEGLDRWSAKSEVAFELVARTALQGDLAFAAQHMNERLVGLQLRDCNVEAAASTQLGTLVGLRSLELNNCSAEQHYTWSYLMDNALARLTRLTSFTLRAMPDAPPKMQRLLAAWPQLRTLHLEEVTAEALPGATLACLSRTSGLRELTVMATANSKMQVLVDLQWLPCGLQKLRLAHAYVPCPLSHERLQRLEELALTSCTYVCCTHLKAALLGLPSLSSLSLVDLPQLEDGHLASLGHLTRLTYLAVCGMGNHKLDGGSIMHVSALVGLRHLRWHVGDLLDLPPNPLALKPLVRLEVLDVPLNTWYRMERWSVTSVMDSLPYCEITTS